MIDSFLEIQPPQEFTAYAKQIELRLSALEQELTQLKAGMTDLPSRSSKKQLWWVEMSGSGADNPLFEDAVRYGQEWRGSAE
jgi:ABC-type phosphate transport system auxiliary subunit